MTITTIVIPILIIIPITIPIRAKTTILTITTMTTKAFLMGLFKPYMPLPPILRSGRIAQTLIIWKASLVKVLPPQVQLIPT